MRDGTSNVKNMTVLMVVDNAGHRTEEFIRNEIRYLSGRIGLLQVLTGPVSGEQRSPIHEHFLEHSRVPLGMFNIVQALPALGLTVLRHRCLIKFLLCNLHHPRETLIKLFKYAPLVDKLQFCYDIVHVQFAHMLYDVNDLRKAGVINSRKVACSFRGHDISQVPLVAKLKTYIERKEQIDLFIPVSELFRSELIAMGAPPAAVITKYSPVDLDAIRRVTINKESGMNEGPLRIVSCGRLIETKGFDILINAIERLVKKYDVELEIIGEGPLRSELNGLVEHLGLSGIITLIGGLPHGEVLQRIAHASVFILCSREPGNGDREGIPNVLKEAMALGTLVIASDHSGIPELVTNRETGLLFKEDSVVSLVKTFGDAVEMPKDEISEIVKNAKTHVFRNFGMEDLGGTQLAAYSSVL